MTDAQKFNIAIISAEPQQQREADRSNERGHRNRNPENHKNHSCVTGA